MKSRFFCILHTTCLRPAPVRLLDWEAKGLEMERGSGSMLEQLPGSPWQLLTRSEAVVRGSRRSAAEPWDSMGSGRLSGDPITAANLVA